MVAKSALLSEIAGIICLGKILVTHSSCLRINQFGIEECGQSLAIVRQYKYSCLMPMFEEDKYSGQLSLFVADSIL
jgi:hypothetical protein